MNSGFPELCYSYIGDMVVFYLEASSCLENK